MGVTIANSAYILKTLWPQDRVENLVYKEHPFFALVKKDESFYGENLVLAVRFADSQGRSAAFATAQANKGNHQGKKFTLTRIKDYQLLSIDSEALLAAKSDKGSLIRNLDTEISSGLNNITKSAAVSLYRGKSGALSQAANSPFTSNKITCKNINDITSFEVGMVLNANPTKSGTVGNMRSGDMVITAVDRDLGIITVDSLAASLANDDYLYAKGDYDAKLCGWDDWVPASAPGATAFFGVDRSVDVTRLGGVRVDASSMNPEEGLVTAFSRLGREGGEPDYGFLNPSDFRNVEIALGSKVQYEPLSVGGIGFSALKVHAGKGVVKLLQDQDVPAGTMMMSQMNTWTLFSLEKMPMIQDLDGDKLSRETSSDGWEIRIAYYAQLGNHAPGYNGRALMPT